MSTIGMGLIHCSFFLGVLALMLSIPDAPQTVVSDFHSSDSKVFCTTDQPLYSGRDGEPIWLDNDSLLKSATHCKAPKMPALGRNARIEGYVSVDIVVNDKGKVAQLINGHPMLASSAINAAKDWTFRPNKQDGKAVWFYGHLRFHFSTGEIKKNDNSCTVAHWFWNMPNC